MLRRYARVLSVVGVLLVALVLAATSCKSRIIVPVKRCVVLGAPATTSPNNPVGQPVVDPSATLWQLYDASAEAATIWVDSADIGLAFLPDLLRVADPKPPPNVGLLGDIEQDVGGFSNISVESDAVVASCEAAWVKHWQELAALEKPPVDPSSLDAGGITVVLIGEFRAGGGGPQELEGFTPSPHIYEGSQKSRVCNQPRQLLPADLRDGQQWTMIETRDSRHDGTQVLSVSHIALTLAHELGHVLLLRHGDGEDNDGDLLFDKDCDSDEGLNEAAAMKNLMATHPNDKLLTAIQKDLARASSRLLRGASGGP